MRGEALDEVVIERRFRGPPDSANGGYACGMLAAHLEPAPAVEVTLRAPPPLDTPLEVETIDGGAALRNGETLVAEARPVEARVLEFPDPVSTEEAGSAHENADPEEHPFPGCFVCGPDRAGEDGLGVLCGPVSGREGELVAGSFQAQEWMADADGHVRPELVWAVLDCPSGIAATVMPEFEGLYMLGRITAQLSRPVETGRTYAAVGWPISNEGRKFVGGSAILGSDGEPLAFASAVWIRLREDGGSG